MLNYVLEHAYFIENSNLLNIIRTYAIKLVN